MRIRAIPIATLILGIAAAVPVWSRGEVTGKVVDRDGKRVGNAIVRFTAQGQSDAVDVEANKKGRFLASGLVDGRYTVELVDAERFIASLEFRIRDANGLVLQEGQIEGHVREGVAGLPVSGRVPLELTVIVADRDSDEARERALAFALPKLSAVADLYNKGDFEAAVVASRTILRDEPDLGEAHYVLGLALAKLDRFAEAAAALSDAVERIPDYPNIWGALGEIRMKQANELEVAGDTAAPATFAGAAEALTEAIAREGESLPLRMNLVAALDHAGQRDRLLPELERLLELDPSHVPSRVRLAALHSERGNQERAMELLREIPATEKRAAVTIYNVAVRLNDEGDVAGSLLAARRAAEIDPQLSHPRRLIAQILLGQPDERPAAIAAIRDFLEIAPDDPEAETYRAILQQLEQQ